MIQFGEKIFLLKWVEIFVPQIWETLYPQNLRSATSRVKYWRFILKKETCTIMNFERRINFNYHGN